MVSVRLGHPCINVGVRLELTKKERKKYWGICAETYLQLILWPLTITKNLRKTALQFYDIDIVRSRSSLSCDADSEIFYFDRPAMASDPMFNPVNYRGYFFNVLPHQHGDSPYVTEWRDIEVRHNLLVQSSRSGCRKEEAGIAQRQYCFKST